MKQHTKHLSFLFPVPASYFNSCVRVIKPFEIKVHYTLDYRGVVAIEGFTVTPGMCRWIEEWEKLEEELQHAAENNAEQYSKPGIYRGATVRQDGQDPYNDIHRQWEQELRETSSYY